MGSQDEDTWAELDVQRVILIFTTPLPVPGHYFHTGNPKFPDIGKRQRSSSIVNSALYHWLLLVPPQHCSLLHLLNYKSGHVVVVNEQMFEQIRTSAPAAAPSDRRILAVPLQRFRFRTFDFSDFFSLS
ncbi:hypothetical protein Salat_2405100 [Sesamum alatum]|uniref:Uncharacterized protein n=1 Tax=Sesamum alatum TaxID=300844 RepID=A0AAE1XYH9_9LAMI|nr:hypothetical protein Salat_2405100 [Sesamum alatum]